MGKIVAIGGGRYDNGEIVGIVKEIRLLCDKEKPGMLFLPSIWSRHSEITAAKRTGFF